MTSFKNMLIRHYNIFAFFRLSENIQSFKTQLFKIVPASLRLCEKILSFSYSIIQHPPDTSSAHSQKLLTTDLLHLSALPYNSPNSIGISNVQYEAS